MDDPARPHLQAVRPYVPGKPAEQLERDLGIKDAIKLASNESPLGPSPRAVKAMAQAAAGVHRYPDADAHELREALCALHGVGPEELALSNGSNELIDLICRTFAGPEDHAVIGTPSFVCYGLSLQVAAVPHTVVPLRDGLFWDLDAMAAAVTERTRLLFIDNPNNPTSTHVDADALERFLRALPDQVIAVIDEAYAHFAEGPGYLSALQLRQAHERTVILRTFSKAYGLAAARVGYGVASAGLVDYLMRARPPFCVSSMAQAGAVAALADEAHLQRYVAMNAAQRSHLSQALQARGLSVAPSRANFLCVAMPGSPQQRYEQLLQRGIIVRELGGGLPGRLRISVGLPKQNDRLLVALDELLG